MKNRAILSLIILMIISCQKISCQTEVKNCFGVSIKPTLTSAKISGPSDLIGGEVSLISMTGQIVKSILISDVNITLSYEGVAPGIYIIRVLSKCGMVNKKVYCR